MVKRHQQFHYLGQIWPEIFVRLKIDRHGDNLSLSDSLPSVSHSFIDEIL